MLLQSPLRPSATRRDHHDMAGETGRHSPYVMGWAYRVNVHRDDVEPRKTVKQLECQTPHPVRPRWVWQRPARRRGRCNPCREAEIDRPPPDGGSTRHHVRDTTPADILAENQVVTEPPRVLVGTLSGKDPRAPM